MKKYFYFISGVVLPDSQNVFKSYFNAEIDLFEKISKLNDISKIQEVLAEQLNVTAKNVIILNYKLLRIE